METLNKPVITVETTVNAPVAKVWEFWTKPEHVKNWNNASDDWHTPHAENDLRIGGTFNFTMAAKDESFKFDFGGTYTNIEEHKLIEYTLGDERKVKIQFVPEGDQTKVIESFEAETENSDDLQRTGWQMIIDNFKKYTEVN
ncbi:MAG: polyketide cyclase [Sphingobacteriales bacterium]|nr:polyketide cyclase [Sphingobacteriales bacterium]